MKSADESWETRHTIFMEKVFFVGFGIVISWGFVVLTMILINITTPNKECQRLAEFCEGTDQIKCVEVMIPRCQTQDKK
jgi:hypothetical protein